MTGWTMGPEKVGTMDIIEKLKEKQGEKSQTEFAAELGITQSYLSKIYAGERRITLDMAKRIQVRFPELALDLAAFLLAPNRPPGPTLRHVGLAQEDKIA